LQFYYKVDFSACKDTKKNERYLLQTTCAGTAYMRKLLSVRELFLQQKYVSQQGCHGNCSQEDAYR
jgi:hypothetical protein